MDRPGEQEVDAPAAAYPLASYVASVEQNHESLVAALVLWAETEAASSEAPRTEDWHTLARLLHTLQSASHLMKTSVRRLWEEDSSQMPPAECIRSAGNLYRLVGRLEEAGHMIRPVFDKAVRPLIRPLNILDLPEELLSKIFELSSCQEAQELRLWFFADHYGKAKDNIRDIQNIRLTCRRFCGASSQFLLWSLDVGLDHASLAFLDEVSRHPSISKGVKAVRINLDMYAFSTPNEALFLQEAVDSLGHALEHVAPRSLESYLQTFDDWQEHLMRLQGLGPLDDELLGDEQDNEAARHSLVAFRQVFERYSELAREERDILKDGAFVKTVAQAIGRMPTATRIFVTDQRVHARFDERRPSLFPLSSRPEVANHPCRRFFESLMRTKSWDWSRRELSDGASTKDVPTGLLHELPLEIARAGATVTYLDLNALVPSIVDFESDLRQDDIAGLKSIGHSLRVFEYRGNGMPENTDFNIQKHSEYLRALATGPKLERLGLMASADAEFDEPWIHMGIFLTPTPLLSRNLRVCCLTKCAFNLDELSNFLGQYKHKSLFIHWKTILLLSGSWAEALDVIRETADWTSQLDDGQGAECDSMSAEEVDAIFGRGPGPAFDCSKATKYIRGERHKNPLLATLDEEQRWETEEDETADGEGDETEDSET